MELTRRGLFGIFAAAVAAPAIARVLPAAVPEPTLKALVQYGEAQACVSYQRAYGELPSPKGRRLLKHRMRLQPLR